MILLYLALLSVVSVLGAQLNPPPRLPLPTGPFKTGVLHLPMTDFTRRDLFDSASFRKLMISVYYPANHTTTTFQELPYLSALISSLFEAQRPFPNGTLHTILANARIDAVPLLLASPRRFIFSHGSGTSRFINTALFEDLASYGYIPIAIDHPYDAAVVEFPDGTVIYQDPSPFSPELVDRWYLQRIMDVNYIDNITSDLSLLLNTSRETETPSRPNPEQIDPENPDFVNIVSDFADYESPARESSTHSNSPLQIKVSQKAVLGGHSFGGSTVAGAMSTEPHRYLGGWNFDGSYWNSSSSGDTKGPFFMMGRPAKVLEGDTSWESFRAAQTEWEREGIVNGTQHWSFTDFAAAFEILGLNQTSPDIQAFVGTIAGEKAIQIQRKYVKDFLDWIFEREEAGGLINGPSILFPEVEFIPQT